MTYKDTLTLYDELVATGTPSEQAKIIAHQQGALASDMENGFNGLNFTLKKIEKDLSWMRIIGAGMVAAYLTNVAAIFGLFVLLK